MVLAQILAQMKDQRRIEIPGFYDDVRELKEEEREQWKRLPFNDRRYAELGAPQTVQRNRLLTLDACGRPTFEVNGMLGNSPATGRRR